MTVAIDRANAVKAARNLGHAGRPEPPGIAGDPELHAAYQDGAGITPPPAPEPAAPAPAKAAPAKAAARPRRSGSRSRRRARRVGGYAARKLGLVRGGSGGGLLLAVWVYPMVVAGLQYGPKGVSGWLNAKFLNEPITKPAPVQSNGGGGAANHMVVK